MSKVVALLEFVNYKALQGANPWRLVESVKLVHSVFREGGEDQVQAARSALKSLVRIGGCMDHKARIYEMQYLTTAMEKVDLAFPL